MAVGRVLVVCVFVFLNVVDISSAAVSDTICTTAGTECDSVPNAECDTSLVGQCEHEYIDNLGSYEEKAVSDMTCTSGGTECDIIPNAECDTSLVCQCEQGYIDILGTCEEKDVSNTVCLNDDECPVNAMCESGTCKCDVGFTENADECMAESGAASTEAVISIVFGSMWILWNMMSIM